MFEEYYFLKLQPSDIILSSILLFFLLIWGMINAQRKRDAEPYYKYYIPGMVLKMLGGILFVMVYLYYYKGGDTIDYFSGANAMNNLFFKSPGKYFDLMFHKITYEKYWSYFDSDTLWPPSSLIRKTENINVVRIASVLSILTFKSFLTSTICFAFISYTAIWRLYKIFCRLFPVLYKQLAWPFLFTPSVFFWGSGIMKDTISIFCICHIIASFYIFFIARRRKVGHMVLFLLACYLLMNIKPYILVALLPGLFIWLVFQRFQNIRNQVLKVILVPLLMGVIFGGGIVFYFQLSGAVGYQSPQEALNHAAIIQQDLIRSEAYGDNFFDIGKIDPTPAGVLSKMPAAINAGLYRPYIWEAGSPVMIISGLENFILLLFTIYSLIKLRIFRLFSSTFKDPVLTLCLTFTIFIAFIVGLTTANFGALVRYKIPLLPFFISFFIILNHLAIQKQKAPEKTAAPSGNLNPQLS